MDRNTIISEFFFCIIGIIFILVAIKALKDKTMKNRISTAFFWFILAFTFILGPYIPNWVTGICVLLIAATTGFHGVNQSKSNVPTPEETKKNSKLVGYKVFIPAITLAISAVIAATFLPFGANNAIGISAVAAIIILFLITKAPPKYPVLDSTRLVDNIGPVGILPQLLAALGALFTVAGVGEVIAKGVSVIIPEGNHLMATIAYCLGMAIFTIIMGNGFTAFSVITVGIGIPFLINQGANPAVVGALGLTAGYCGTLITPMAGNFNIMPAALLETKDKYVIIKSQIPVAAVLFVIHVILMYVLAFRI